MRRNITKCVQFPIPKFKVTILASYLKSPAAIQSQLFAIMRNANLGLFSLSFLTCLHTCLQLYEYSERDGTYCHNSKLKKCLFLECCLSQGFGNRNSRRANTILLPFLVPTKIKQFLSVFVNNSSNSLIGYSNEYRQLSIQVKKDLYYMKNC